MASCETTRALASMLNVVTDRLAILCTSPINHRTAGFDPMRIWPLSSVKVRKLKTALDAIVNTKERPTTSSWARTINFAIETLQQSTVSDLDKDLLQDTFGHIFILTTNGKGLSPDMLTHEKLQFHVICPASVPLREFDAITSNGWKLRSICGNEAHTVKTEMNNDASNMFSRLRHLVLHARNGREASKLTYLSLDFEPGPGCSIERIMGKNECLALHPGELRTVLVRLNISASCAQKDQMARSNALPDLGPDSMDILKDLGNMLKAVPATTNILTARLVYQHSLLPAGTICSADVDCRVSRRISNSVHGAHLDKPLADDIAGCTVLVHERLAYHLATHGSLRRAFSAFSSEFGEEGWRSYCPDYTHLIFKELKYQARIMERLEVDASPRKPIRPLTMNMSPSPTSCMEEPFDHGLCETGSNRSDGYSTEAPTEKDSELSGSTCVPPVRSENTIDSALHSTQNEANIDWEEMEKTVRRRKRGSGARATSLKQQARWSMLREGVTIARRQRSESSPSVVIKNGGIGALRHITSAGESMGKGLGAL